MQGRLPPSVIAGRGSSWRLPRSHALSSWALINVIVPQIRGGATVMDDVFADQDGDDEDNAVDSKEATSALGSWLGSYQ